MIVEGTVCGTFFALLWRWNHNQNKAQINRFYANYRQEKLAEGDEE
jgi:hypothetical protein